MLVIEVWKDLCVLKTPREFTDQVTLNSLVAQKRRPTSDTEVESCWPARPK